jgi:hypothetical protein
VLATFAVAAQLAIVAHAPDTVYACDAVEVSVAVSADGRATPRLAVPSFAPFDLLRGATTPRVEYARAAMVAEYRFIVTTDQVGRFTIPPFSATVGEQRVSSSPITLTVRPSRGRGTPVVVARARIDTSEAVSLRAVAVAETVYVGQQATYEVAVFLNQTVRERLRRNPTFYPPEMQAMLAYDLPAPAASQRKHGSQCFDALVYRRALFPLISGRLVIPPAQLVYSTGLSSSSLFSREESHELQTDSVAIIAIDPPTADRPPEYMGAVGNVRLDTRMDSVASRVGDPMLLTVRVTGSGNVKLFPRPAVRVPWAALVPADERVRIDSASSRIGGVKEFDWVLTPRIAGEFDVPSVRYGYFDPSQRRYGVAASPGRRIRVPPGALASADTGNAESALGIRMRYGGESWPPVQSRFAFWLVMALAPMPAIAARLRRRARRPSAVVDDPMRALTSASFVDDPALLRRNFVRALGQRLGYNPEDFTHPGALERVLRRAGVSVMTARRAESLLRDLDVAAYTRTVGLPPQAAKDAAEIARAVDAEALSRMELPFWVPALLLAACLTLAASAGALWAAADGADTHFARGVSAYVRQDYRAAQHSFADAVAVAPAAPDAWANYGTASWSLADTAAAVLGWRQTLAIEPGASDIQQRIMLPREEGPSAPGWVPELPRGATVYLFALLWLAAWAFAWVARNPHPWAGRVPLPLAACALVIGLASIELETRIAGKRLAVVRHVSTLVTDPAIGMDRGPSVGTGEIVRIAGRRGTWTRVEATDDRDGWIPSSQLLPLADRRTPRD